MTTSLPLTVQTAYRPSRPVRYMLGGAVVGLIAAILITFVMALVDGQAQGMSAGSCVLYGCVLTVLLSQMAGFSGMAVGAGMGALAGGIVHLVRDPARTR